VRELIGISLSFCLAACINRTLPIQIPNSYKQLTGAEIKNVFDDAADQAQVQDSLNTTAENQWYSDGSFISVWTNRKQSGTVTGQWFVRDNTRCVIIKSGLPSMSNHTKCGPIYQHQNKYYTINPDGSIHGIHTLTKLSKVSE